MPMQSQLVSTALANADLIASKGRAVVLARQKDRRTEGQSEHM